jgi:hypothetical protein
MGLSLLANLSAYDFGYLTAGELIERTHNALETMQGLERHRGHFYNWYDTRSLKPLPPLYISSVDSGNLACHLLTLRPGLLALADASILAPRCFEGLRDTAALIGSTGPEVDSLRGDIESALPVAARHRKRGDPHPRAPGRARLRKSKRSRGPRRSRGSAGLRWKNSRFFPLNNS